MDELVGKKLSSRQCFINFKGKSGEICKLTSHPLARRKAPVEGRRSEGEGANIDRRLVPYGGKCKRIQSHIEFIYIYLYASTASSCAASENLALVNSLQQKLI